ncbi:M48 family metallopeptidase [Aurantivibrio plasticivorans]
MKYSNPQIPEGINVSQEHPLKEFFILLAGVSAIVVVAVFVLALLAEWLVRFIPFETEAALVSDGFAETTLIDSQRSTGDQAIEDYLQALSDRLTEHMDLVDGMSITVHYSDDDLVNAYATLGGHVVVYRGLLEKLNSENALAMVVAHEAAHIAHRDPIVAMGRGLTVGLALACITGFGDSGMSQQLLGQLSLFTALSFNRGQETEADRVAMRAVLAEYGHIEGAADLFELFKKQRGELTSPELLSTHPLDDSRIQAIEAFANESKIRPGYRAEKNETTPLPEIILQLANDNSYN